MVMPTQSDQSPAADPGGGFPPMVPPAPWQGLGYPPGENVNHAIGAPDVHVVAPIPPIPRVKRRSCLTGRLRAGSGNNARGDPGPAIGFRDP
jgi:hypothetical protein